MVESFCGQLHLAKISKLYSVYPLLVIYSKTSVLTIYPILLVHHDLLRPLYSLAEYNESRNINTPRSLSYSHALLHTTQNVYSSSHFYLPFPLLALRPSCLFNLAIFLLLMSMCSHSSPDNLSRCHTTVLKARHLCRMREAERKGKICQ